MTEKNIFMYKEKSKKKSIVQRSRDLNFFLECLLRGHPTEPLTKQAVKNLNLCGKTAAGKSPWIKT